MNTQTEQILLRANELREAEQYGESAKTYTDCLDELIKSNDKEGLIHCLSGQSQIYKLLTHKNPNPIYLHLAIAYAKESYEIAEQNKNNLDGRTVSIAYSTYADALLENSNPKEALILFEKSLAISIADVPEKGRLKAHIGYVKYLLGEKEIGINLINEALADIRTGDLSSYAIRVWETGAINGLVKILFKEGKIDEAKKLAEESLQIATANNLSIRKREIEEIITRISSGNSDFSI